MGVPRGVGVAGPEMLSGLIKLAFYRQLPLLPRLITGEVEEDLTVNEVQVKYRRLSSVAVKNNRSVS